MALKWPILCWCAVKKLLTHSLLYRTVVVVEVIEFINLAAAVSHCTVLMPLVVCSLEMYWHWHWLTGHIMLWPLHSFQIAYATGTASAGLLYTSTIHMTEYLYSVSSSVFVLHSITALDTLIGQTLFTCLSRILEHRFTGLGVLFDTECKASFFIHQTLDAWFVAFYVYFIFSDTWVPVDYYKF